MEGHNSNSRKRHSLNNRGVAAPMQRIVEFDRIAQLLGAGSITPTQWQSLLQQCVAMLLRSPDFSEASLVSGAAEQLGMDENDFAAIFTATFMCVRQAASMFKPGLQSRGKTDVQTYTGILETEFSALSLKPEFLSPLVQILSRNAPALYAAVHGRVVRLPGSIASMRWRVEVTLSTSTMNRVLRPAVILELSLTDGTTKTVELDVATFHALRFNVAKILKDVLTVEQNDALKRVV